MPRANRKKSKKTIKTAKQTTEAQPQLSLEHSDAFRRILSLLKAKTEIDVSQYKSTTIGRRIQRQMKLHKISDIGEYLSILEKSPESVNALSTDIFIHVTEFFRDLDSFEALKKKIFPRLLSNRTAHIPLRIWIPGCSTGEEAYSIAISLFEYLEEQNEKVPIQIFSTDISEQAVEKARAGQYQDSEVDGLSKERLEKFFDETKDGYKIKKAVRDVCIFSRHDLTNNPPFAKIDLISCRNVLIYFDPNLQKQVMPIFHYALNANGYLWLGRSEAPSGISKLFSLADKTHKIFSKIGTAAPMSFRFPINRPSDRLDITKKAASHLAATLDHQKEVERIGFSRYAPAGAVINTDMEIIQVRGHTAHFLELPSGQPSYNFLKMVRPELLPGIRMAIQIAQKTNAPARKEGLSYAIEKVRRKVDVEVIPLNPQAAPKERQFVVFFEEAKAKKKKSATDKLKKATKGKRTGVDPKDAYIAELLQELDAMRDYQQSVAEGYEAAQEELTSSNEELQSTLEEFQSTNEELETAKEELQATNEELATLNDELQHRNEELAKSEERFRLLVSGVKDYAIFMLDTNGIITSWNEGARRLKGYEDAEIIGQHFSKFYTSEDLKRSHPQHELDIARRNGKYEEEGWRVRKDGSRFWASILITRIDDSNGNHIGFSKVTRDLTEHKRMEDELRKSRDELEVKVKQRTEELASALNVRDEFLSIASHELKTPLTSLKLQLQITARNTKPEQNLAPNPEELAQSLTVALRQIESLTDLVETLLDISRIRTGKFIFSPSDVNLADLVNAIIAQIKEQLDAAGIRLELNLEKGLTGHWDQHRFEQVLVNLITNAIKYAPKSVLRISTRVKGETASLTIEDTGPGISPDKLPKIFERFERAGACRNVGGLGLGLFIAKEIVEAHSGRIDVDSKIGRGTKFHIELPLRPNLAEAKESEGANGQ